MSTTTNSPRAKTWSPTSNVWTEAQEQRLKEDRDHWLKVSALRYNETTPALEAWMEAKRWKTIRADLAVQLDKARRKGSKKTLIPLDTLEKIIGALP